MGHSAVVPVTTYDHWLKEQIGFKARNKAKQAEKKGVVIREVPFSESLVKGIWEVYNECPVGKARLFATTEKIWTPLAGRKPLFWTPAFLSERFSRSD